MTAACGGEGTPPLARVGPEATPATEAPEVRADDRAAVNTTVSTLVAGSAGEPAEPETPATTTTAGTEAIEASVEVPVEDTDAPAETGEETPAATSTTLPAPGEEASTEVIVSEDVPDMELLDLSSGSMVSLRSVVTGDTPLLFWFWSPL